MGVKPEKSQNGLWVRGRERIPVLKHFIDRNSPAVRQTTNKDGNMKYNVV